MNWNFFIDRLPVSWLIVIGLTIAGIFSYINLPREIQPEISIPYGIVTTVLPGAGPADVESLVTEPLEKSIASISDIRTLSSVSSLGLSMIAVEFEAQADLSKSIDDLKNAVERAESELPEDAISPFVAQADTNAFSVISFSLIGRPLAELTPLADDIADDLREVSGVSKVESFGGQKEYLEVLIDPEKASQYGLTLPVISAAIKMSGPNVPVGITSFGERNYSLRIDNRFEKVADLLDTPLLPNVQLRDIAVIKRALPDKSTITKLSSDGMQSQEAVTLQVFKKNGSNILDVVDGAKELVANADLPDGVQVEISNDNSFYIRSDLGILTSNGIQTTIMIIVILFLAMGLIEGLIAGLSIPLSLLFAFVAMDFMGLSINSLTLFSLVIALGIMVDTAIVIMEGIHVNMKNGMNSFDAAKASVMTYKNALIAGTLTTVFAFFPMLIVSGIVGEFLKSLPLTISAVLLGALVLSLTVGPAITASFLSHRSGKPKKTLLDPVFGAMERFFAEVIREIVAKKFWRISVPLISLVLFIASLFLPLSGALGVEMFPVTDTQFFIINVEAPKGTLLRETEKRVAKIENVLRGIPEIDNFLTIVGSAQSQVPTDIISVSSSAESHLANITVNLLEKEERERKSYEVATEVREILGNFSGSDLQIKVSELREGPPSSAPITVRISGEDTAVLRDLADQIRLVVDDVEGTVNSAVSLQSGLGEMKFILDREKIANYGLSMMQVAGLMRSVVQGELVEDLSIGGEENDILFKYDLPSQDDLSPDDIQDISLMLPGGFGATGDGGISLAGGGVPASSQSAIRLSDLADLELGEGLSSISRENQKQIVKVTSELEQGFAAVPVTSEIRERLQDFKVPDGYSLDFLGDTADIDESFADLFRSMIVGVLLIAVSLVLMFNSLKQPFIIMLTLPMALIGVFPGLTIIGLKLSFPAFLGIVALAGVVVNDAIVLIDRINENRKNGMEFDSSITEAAQSRLQPIIMTSITTIIGILPLAISNEFWRGLGFSLIFGLTFSTVLTLVVVPVLYHNFEIRAERRRQSS